MKIILKNIIIVTIIITSCQNRSFEITLPDSIPLHSHELYLNGERNTVFEPEFYIMNLGLESGHSLLVYKFEEEEMDDGFTQAVFSIGRAPVREGKISLVEEQDLNDDFASTKFGLSIGEDTPGDEYKPIRLDEGFLEVIEYDFETKTVLCRFKANFKRTRIRTNNTVFPKFLEFEGIFHDTMTIW